MKKGKERKWEGGRRGRKGNERNIDKEIRKNTNAVSCLDT